MFNFSNLQSLLSVNWKKVFSEYVPKDTYSLISKEDYQDIFSGGILSLISHIALIIINVILASRISSSVVLSMSFINYIPIILDILMMFYYYNLNTKSVKTNGSINYLFLILVIFYTGVLVLYLIPWLLLINKSFFLTILAIISICGILLSNLFILSGVIGYAELINEENEEAHRDKIIHPNIEVTRIDKNDVSDHSFKYCSRCGHPNNNDSYICSKCGNML